MNIYLLVVSSIIITVWDSNHWNWRWRIFDGDGLLPWSIIRVIVYIVVMIVIVAVTPITRILKEKIV